MMGMVATAISALLLGVAAASDDATTLTWLLSVAVVPALVLMAAVIMSLEILEHTLVARCLSALVMLLIWGGLLTPEVQVRAICGAIVYHCVQEAYVEWSRGFPCIFQPQTARKITLWSLFWVRVFTWGATFAAVGFTTRPSTDAQPGIAAVLGVALLFVAYCESIEVLVLLYLADQRVPYLWRHRVVLWCLSLLIGLLHAGGLLPRLVKWILSRISPFGLVVALLGIMWISLRVPWHRVVDGLSSMGRSVLRRQPKRKSILYHSSSEVEVVKLQEKSEEDDEYTSSVSSEE
ncbi:hypothetical protein Poli38472_011573 [Pythium oligandrum]|uniref:Transmembrane protein n=1 Tax=Pythium oligandrum TaxID=41045 RepID=A0A8K1FNJ4_PYTOL|nr:hypothetical protein Poli38472_011573 [Pythium oligandrum]|eukprot:TMW64693.1 hypothetical protein Poli38472_011573 [Pythium oligandrum]